LLVAEPGDAIEFGLVFVDTTFQNQNFSPEESFDTFDDLGTVPFEHYDFALSRIPQSARLYRAEHRKP